jgi:hypothetical protein
MGFGARQKTSRVVTVISRLNNTLEGCDLAKNCQLNGMAVLSLQASIAVHPQATDRQFQTARPCRCTGCQPPVICAHWHKLQSKFSSRHPQTCWQLLLRDRARWPSTGGHRIAQQPLQVGTKIGT